MVLLEISDSLWCCAPQAGQVTKAGGPGIIFGPPRIYDTTAEQTRRQQST